MTVRTQILFSFSWQGISCTLSFCSGMGISFPQKGSDATGFGSDGIVAS